MRFHSQGPSLWALGPSLKISPRRRVSRDRRRRLDARYSQQVRAGRRPGHPSGPMDQYEDDGVGDPGGNVKDQGGDDLLQKTVSACQQDRLFYKKQYIAIEHIYI